MKFLEKLKITLEISMLLVTYCLATCESVCAGTLKYNDITVKQLSKYGLSKEEITLIRHELNIVSEEYSSTTTADGLDGKNSENEKDNSKKEVARQANDASYETGEASITEQKGKSLLVDNDSDEDDDQQANGEIDYETREASITEQEGKSFLVDGKDFEEAEAEMREEEKERQVKTRERQRQEVEDLEDEGELSEDIEEDQEVSDGEEAEAEMREEEKERQVKKRERHRQDVEDLEGEGELSEDIEEDQEVSDGEEAEAEMREEEKERQVKKRERHRQDVEDLEGKGELSEDIEEDQEVSDGENEIEQRNLGNIKSKFMINDSYDDVLDDGDSPITKNRRNVKNISVKNNETNLDRFTDAPRDSGKNSDRIINRKRTLNNVSRNKPAQKSRNRFIDDDSDEDDDPEYDFDNDNTEEVEPEEDSDQDDSSYDVLNDGDNPITKNRRNVKNILVKNNETNLDRFTDAPRDSGKNSDRIINRKRTLNNVSRNKPAQKSRNRFIDDDSDEDDDPEYDFDNDNTEEVEPEEDSDQDDSYDEDYSTDEKNRNNQSYNNGPRNISPFENYTKSPAESYKNGDSLYDPGEYNQAGTPNKFDNESRPNERNNIISHNTPIYKNREMVGNIVGKRPDGTKRNINSNTKKNTNAPKKQKKITPVQMPQCQVVYWPYMYYGCNLPKNCTNLFYYPAYQCMQSCNKPNVQCSYQKPNNDRCCAKRYANKCIMDEAAKRRLEFEAESFVKNRCRK